MKLKYFLQYPLDEVTDPGESVTPAPTSVETQDDDFEPIVDDFLAVKPEPTTPESPAEPVAPSAAEPQAPAPVAKPSDQPVTPESTAPAPTPPKPAEQPPVATAPQPPATPVQAPVAPPASAAPTPTPPATPAPTAEEVSRQREEYRKNYLADLEKKFVIPDSDKDALLTSPETVLPKFAAQVSATATEAAIAAILQNFNQLVEVAIQQRETVKQSENEFFTKWPKLNTAEGRQVSTRLLKVYMETHKDATREQAMGDVGLLAHAALRLPLDGLSVPQSTPQSTMAPPPPPPPAVPGAGGGRPMSMKPTVWDRVDAELFGEE